MFMIIFKHIIYMFRDHIGIISGFAAYSIAGKSHKHTHIYNTIYIVCYLYCFLIRNIIPVPSYTIHTYQLDCLSNVQPKIYVWGLWLLRYFRYFRYFFTFLITIMAMVTWLLSLLFVLLLLLLLFVLFYFFAKSTKSHSIWYLHSSFIIHN